MEHRPKLITRKVIADFFHVNVRTIDRWIDIGTIRSDEVVKVGGTIRIKESAIDRIMKGGENDS